MGAVMAPPKSPISGLAARGLRPASELAKNRPHGDRLRYMGGCRCSECRGANTAYEKARVVARKAGDWNGFVDAQAARQHLQQLSVLGVGRHSVSDASGVADSILFEIVSGTKTRIRARTERVILAVTREAAADHAYVCAKSTWVLLDELIADGYTRGELALAMGRKTASLQVGRRQVTVRTRFGVQRLHERLHFVNGHEASRKLDGLRAEGFRPERIELELQALALERGIDPLPSMTPRHGRLHHQAVQLIHEVHTRLTA